MNPFGSAWLLDREGNCIEVYAHPSEKFEFESIVDVVSKYGSDGDREYCNEWIRTKSEASKAIILYEYAKNWCKVRLWGDNKLTFRITSEGFNWYLVIVEFLLTHPYFQQCKITVENIFGKIYWNNETYDYSIDPANEEILSSVFTDAELITV